MAQTFDPKKVSLIVDGRFIVGYMDGTFIGTEKNEDNITPHVGAHGDVTYSRNADDTGTITVTLKQNSSSLPHLIALSKQDRDFAANIIDANDNKIKAGGNQCRIVKTPSVDWGAEVGGVEVKIFVADYNLTA